MSSTPSTTTTSAAVRALWAKSPTGDEKPLALLTHLADACEVAELYWHEFASQRLRDRTAAVLGGDERLALVLVRWLAAAHDTGKATPSFAGQVPSLREHVERGGLPLLADPKANSELRHDLAGAELWTERLRARGWKRSTATSYTSIIAGHHGTFAGRPQLHFAANDRHFTGRGKGEWRAAQAQVMDAVERIAGIAARDFEALAGVELPVPLQLQLTGVVIHADWIASDASRFPLGRPDGPGVPDGRDSRTRAVEAWHDLALPAAWRLSGTDESIDERYRHRFAWSDDLHPRPVQRAALELAEEVAPGLLVIEAPMGTGKTEAALAVAEEWAARSGASGIYVALPTMATSDAMLDRVLEWVDRVPGAERASVFLAHSKRAFNATFSALPRTAWRRTRGDTDACDEHAAVAEWLTGRRRGIAANVVVGTVDHVLMLALRSRYSVLRYAALAGKVVVIDEVHASDTRMLAFLERALEWLAASSVPVILLSATLPGELRERLVVAYEEGVAARTRARSAQTGTPTRTTVDLRAAVAGAAGTAIMGVGGVTDECGHPGGESQSPYPLLTAVGGNGGRHVVAPGSRGVPRTSVRLEPLDDDLDLLVRVLRERTRDGGCVLIVRNTVARAVSLFEALRADPDLGQDVTLAHSRFIGPDRAANDAGLVDRFGPPAAGRERPGGVRPAIVVATQVAEMSLDVDFDLLVSDLAPVDAVLQRIGRLHRHARAHRPAPLVEASCLITGVTDWQASPPALDRGGVRVYGASAQLRAVRAFSPYLEPAGPAVRLPDDIAPLVERAHEAVADDEAAWLDAVSEADRVAHAARGASLAAAENWRIRPLRETPTLAGFSATALEDRNEQLGYATVRDGEETFEVLLLSPGDDESSLRTLPCDGAPGVLVSITSTPSPSDALAAAACSVRLPAWVCVGAGGDRVIEALERNHFPAWDQSPHLRGQLVIRLDAHGSAEVADYTVRYDAVRGLEVTRAERS